MATVLFWLVWGIISFWALRAFYYAFSKKKLEHLRKSALCLNLAAFVLTFIPTRQPTFFSLLLFVSLVLFVFRDALLLKIGSALTILATILLFVSMVSLKPGSFSLTRLDIAPILTALLLLVNTVAVLLLWQQLDLRKKKRT